MLSTLGREAQTGMIRQGTLETARLIVRPFIASDAPRLVEIFADPNVARYVGDGQPLSPTDADRWVINSAANLARFGYGTGAVVEKDSGQVIGWAGFARPDDGQEEIIYGFARPFWNKGYGRELLSALVAFAAERGIDPLRATVDPENLISIRLLTAHGFSRVISGYGGDPDTDLYVRAVEAALHG